MSSLSADKIDLLLKIIYENPMMLNAGITYCIKQKLAKTISVLSSQNI